MEFLQNEAAMIGVLALITSIITEMTKNIGFLKKTPTVLQVVVTAVVLAVIAYIAQCAADGTPVIWYMLVARVIVGVIAAFVATYGWDKLQEIIQRFIKTKKGD